MDNIVGTSGNDTINGYIDVATAANATLNTPDQINGGAGTDSLNVTLAGQIITNAATGGNATVNATNAANITGIETLNIRNVTTNVAGTASGTNTVTATVDASTVAGLKDLNADSSIGAVTVTNLASGASAGMIGNGTVTNGALNAGYVAAATAATVNVSGGTKAGAVTITGTGLTSATVNSTGAANTIGALTGAASTTSTTIAATTDLTTGAVTNAGAKITVTGAGKVNLSPTALQSAVKTIDASANTGGLTVKLSDAVDIKVTGSAGNDVITTNAILTTGTVDGGAGTDTLDVGTNVDHINTAALGAKYTNFETLRVNGTIDASLVAGINAIELSDETNNVSKLSATQAAAVTARADIGATTLALTTATGTSDVLSLTMGTGLTTSAATNAGALTINGFETLNVKTNAGATATAGADRTTTIASFTADSLTAINLTGTAVTLTNAATTKAVTIDGSALTGNGATAPIGLTISDNLATGSVVKGSATAGNTFNLGTVGSSYTGGAGKDGFNATAVTQLRNGATYNVIDGGAGEDTLTLTASAITMVDDDFKEIKNIEKIVLDADGGAGDVSITTGGWYDAAFKAAGIDLTILADNDAVSFTGGTFTGAQKLTVTTGTATKDTTILTGSGDDTVKVTANSLTTGDITVSTGAGADSIEIDVSADVASGAAIAINGGAGKDTIKIVDLNAADAQYVTVTVGAGQSTTTAYDSITGFSMGAAARSVLLDFAGSAVAATAQSAASVTGYTAAELTYTIASGVLSFAGSSAAGLTFDQKISLVDTLVATNLHTVAFAHGSNTFVYNENSTGDSLVELVGIIGVTILGLAADNTGATTVNIA